ncbi:hypothetical protein Clacol_004726 [Clathrus columnatus]|uniref:Actin-like ATPase domain-containing protein n=1 Tax=Clathrus columnatus TaxID=1419009 RepID=A0AAV5A890_9AGAM|nr:hypothetical protein Clacol_004726 [Clathrus columnatus]
MSVPNGTASVGDERETVIGINFGNSFSSIAIITKEGKAECIANEAGERQIPSCIAFHGEEMYVGDQATHHLIKNSQNTITNFRNLLGKKFSEISSEPQNSLAPSAPMIQHPTLSDTPCYAVQVLVPSPSPLPPLSTTPIPPSSKSSSKPSTAVHTPLDTPTPRSEPNLQTRYITPQEACSIFLRSLHHSASDFLGCSPRGVVLSVPQSFDDTQRAALLDAAREAGLNVIQLLEETVAATAVLVDAPANRGSEIDKTSLLIDWGSTDLTVTLLSIRSGLVHTLASRRAPELGSAQQGGIDEVLIKYFAKEFSKKTGESFAVCPPTSSSARGQTKLALALPALKRSLTAAILSGGGSGQPGTDTTKSAQLSVESLHAGLDFSAPLNRIRAGALFGPVWSRFTAIVENVLSDATSSPVSGGTDAGLWLDTIAFIGGTGALASVAGASSTLLASGLMGTRKSDEEEVRDENLASSPEEVIARGCAIHARDILSLDEEVKQVILQQSLSGRTPKEISTVKITTCGIGAIIPIPSGQENGTTGSEFAPAEDVGKHFIPLLPPNTPLPLKRTVRFQVALSGDITPTPTLYLELYEYTFSTRVHIVPPVVYSDAEEDEEVEPEEPEEERYRSISKGAYLGSLQLPLNPISSEGEPKKSKQKKIPTSVIEILVEISNDEKVDIAAREVRQARAEGEGESSAEWVKLSLGPTLV